MALNVHQFAKIVAKKTGRSVKETESTLWAAFGALAQELAAGESLRVSNFGTLEPVDRAPRKAKNQSTGDIVDVPAYRSVRFRVTGRLREMVRSGDVAGDIRKPLAAPRNV